MNRLEYLDFDVLFEKSGEAYVARVLNSPCGQATSRFSLPFSPLQVENLLLRVGRTRRGVRRLESPEMGALRAFGSQLFSAVFDNEVLGCLRSSLNESYRSSKGLRLRLRFSATPELVDLPWEFLYDPAHNQFLVLSIETPLVRYLELPLDVQPLPVHLPLQVLVMIASPQDYPPLDVEREWAKLKEALGDLEARGQVAVTRLETATLASLQRQLRRRQFHIFHFIGHGVFNHQAQDGVLLTEDETGRGRPVSGYDLGTLLHDHRSLRLAVLNACEGARSSINDPFAGAAQSLVQQGLPAVIAMQFEITDPAAITLAHEFYSAVADGYAVDAALAEARKAIFAQGNDVEWATPVLYLRSPSGAIFSLEPAKPEPGTPEAKPRLAAGEVKAQVEQLYTEGLSAYWLEEWENACQSFEAVLRLQPNHAEAKARLASARRNLHLENLSQQALEAEETGDWEEAVPVLEKLAAEAPTYKDANTRLEAARKRKQLDDLYEEARQLSQAGKWQAVTNIFTRISALDPSAPDPDGLLPQAQEELERQQQQALLESLYNQAVRELDAGRWEQAAKLLREVQEKQPGYRQAGRLLSRAEAEMARLAIPPTPQPEEPVAGSPPTRQVESKPPVEPPAMLPKPTGAGAQLNSGAAAAPGPFSAYRREGASLFAQAARPALLVGAAWVLAALLADRFTSSKLGDVFIGQIYAITNSFLNYDLIRPMLNNIVIGIFSGVALGLCLRTQQVSLGRGRFVRLVAIWTVTNSLTIIFYKAPSLGQAVFLGLIVGGLGGWATGALLAGVRSGFNRQGIFLTALGWSIGMGVAVWMIYVIAYSLIYKLFSSSAAEAIVFLLSIGIFGFIGGLATFYALKSRAGQTG
jgi:outer membrane protein assembly factor BamD (BamD/ComL family)